MPLDSEGYLISQGWAGKGTALRQGSLVRPLAIPQKKTLAGLGKDRDEAFPFWDHLFSAAAKSIQLKCADSDDESGSDDPSLSSGANLKRTSTGIISNRRPITGTPAHSGSNTPDPCPGAQQPRLSLMAAAKREAAKRGLYSRFFRGPILGPESMKEEERRLERILGEAMKVDPGEGGRVRVKEHVEIEVGGGKVVVDLEVEKEAGKKRKEKKRKERDEGDGDTERKRRRKEKEERREKKKSKAKCVDEEVAEKKKSKGKSVDEEEVAEKKKKGKSKKHAAKEDEADLLTREEKKRRKEKKEKERKLEEEVEEEQAPITSMKEKSSKKSKKTKHSSSKYESSDKLPATDEGRKSKKKKRKHEEVSDDSDSS